MHRFRASQQSVAAVTSNTTRCMKEGVERSEYSLIYFTPEMLPEVRKWRELFLKSCFKSRVKALVVDPQDKQRTEGLSAILMLNSLGTSTVCAVIGKPLSTLLFHEISCMIPTSPQNGCDQVTRLIVQPSVGSPD